MRADVREAVLRLAKRAGPREFDTEVHLRKQFAYALGEAFGLFPQRAIAPIGVAKRFVFATGNDTTIGCRAQIEVWMRVLPDHAAILTPTGHLRHGLAGDGERAHQLRDSLFEKVTRLISRGKYHVARLDAIMFGRRQRHAAIACVDIENRRAIEHPQPPLRGVAEQSM